MIWIAGHFGAWISVTWHMDSSFGLQWQWFPNT